MLSATNLQIPCELLHSHRSSLCSQGKAFSSRSTFSKSLVWVPLAETTSTNLVLFLGSVSGAWAGPRGNHCLPVIDRTWVPERGARDNCLVTKLLLAARDFGHTLPEGFPGAHRICLCWPHASQRCAPQEVSGAPHPLQRRPQPGFRRKTVSVSCYSGCHNASPDPLRRQCPPVLTITWREFCPSWPQFLCKTQWGTWWGPPMYSYRKKALLAVTSALNL